MTANEKINEVLAIMSHLNYRLNNDPRDRQYVEEWIDELKAEMPSNEQFTVAFPNLAKTIRRQHELQQTVHRRTE
jgi:hypothetical protein